MTRVTSVMKRARSGAGSRPRAQTVPRCRRNRRLFRQGFGPEGRARQQDQRGDQRARREARRSRGDERQSAYPIRSTQPAPTGTNIRRSRPSGAPVAVALAYCPRSRQRSRHTEANSSTSRRRFEAGVRGFWARFVGVSPRGSDGGNRRSFVRSATTGLTRVARTPGHTRRPQRQG